MMTLRISDDTQRAWLDCEFCGRTYSYPFPAQLARKGTAPFPTLEQAIRSHYYLDEHGSFKFAPCPKHSEWIDADCQLVDEDHGHVMATGRVTFTPLFHAGKVRGYSLEILLR